MGVWEVVDDYFNAPSFLVILCMFLGGSGEIQFLEYSSVADNSHPQT